MPKRILIAEDDGFMSKMLKGKLTEKGYEVDLVSNGQDAFDKASKDAYDLVITDLIMPQIDGFQLLKMLKEASYKGPIFVFSNLTQPEDEEEVMRLGAAAYLSKSSSLEELLALIQKHIG